MKKGILLLGLILAACDKRTQQITIIAENGKDGTSCSVAQEIDSETEQAIGAKISCTDGSFAVIYNGKDGAQGVQGPQGNQGVQGPQGQAGASCQAYKSNLFDGVWLKCPTQLPVLISNGQDGASCSSTREESKNRVRITCGKNVTYVYDGKNGSNGTSCTANSAPGGANVTCGNNPPVFLANGAPGPAGTNGTNGKDGLDGKNGVDGEDALKPGLSCNVHDLRNWDKIKDIKTVLDNNAPLGEFVLPNLNVGDSPSSAGFPSMPASIQNLVGTTGYALDCYGYLNVQTTGMHTFKMLSDDGVRLVIEEETLIDNPGLHAPTLDVSKSVELHRGPNKINVVYYQGPHTQIALRLSMSGPNFVEQVIPSTLFRH
jgi:hypothetical protein